MRDRLSLNAMATQLKDVGHMNTFESIVIAPKTVYIWKLLFYLLTNLGYIVMNNS